MSLKLLAALHSFTTVEVWIKALSWRKPLSSRQHQVFLLEHCPKLYQEPLTLTLLFTTMLTDPRINTYFVTTSCGLFLTCRGDKYLQNYSILYYVQQLMYGLSNAKKPYLVWWPSLQGCQLPSTPVPCCNLAAPFPTCCWPHPIPWSHPSTPRTHTCDTILNWQNRTSAHLKSF